MKLDEFQQRKRDILSKLDKSSIGKWDLRIINICNKINSLDNYYTSSSCSGRIVLIKDSEKKGPSLFEFVSHDLISLEQLKNKLINLKGNVKFKQEPCILHIFCKDLKSSQEFLNKAKFSGWKNSGIISSGKRFVIEMSGTNKLEFPILSNSKLLVGDNFLEIIIKKSNNNLKKSWEKIKRLETFI